MSVERKENLFQPPEYTAEMFAEYFEIEKARALRVSEIEAILDDDYDLDRLRELVEADRDGRCMVLPKDGMVYYIEEAGGEKWVANKPIQQITVKCGWGLASLEFSLLDTGKYFSREAAEAALKGETHDNSL